MSVMEGVSFFMLIGLIVRPLFYSLAQHSALFSLPISISKPRIMMPLLRMSSANVLKSIPFYS